MCSNVDWGIAFCGNIVIRDSCIVIDALDIDAVIAALTDRLERQHLSGNLEQENMNILQR